MAIPDRLDRIPESGIRRLFELAGRYKDVVSLGIGEPDFDTPQHIKEYAKEGLDKGMTHYTPNNGLKMLRDAIAVKLKKENGIEADPDKNIIVTIGGNQAFLLVLSTFLNPGDEVLLPSPYFVTYGAAVTLVGGRAVEVETRLENGFRVDAEDLRKAVTKKTRCIIINSPNNPTGAVLTKKDLGAIAEVAVENDLKVITDEVYEKLVYDGAKHVSIASLNGMSDRTIIVNSFSKTYAMTGWRLGYAVADEATVARMTKFQMFLATCPVSFGQYAAAKALQDPRSREATERMRSEYESRRDYIYRKLKKIKAFTVAKPQGAFYIFPRIDGKDDSAFSEKLLVEEKVVVVPGSAFGRYGVHHLRLCYATSMKNLEVAMNRVESFMCRSA
ncbi:MAG: pyridoxal phosphate-dependent aminotransferase [Candidatus Verstraetearchaeota archaeon]|nr:pyridoxal phosphate-dependent aminotransferase [Candidatus Verstraetearchaeota archaeon]